MSKNKMELTCQLIELNDVFAICSLSLIEEHTITVHATAHAHESGRYADLAQARALKLAHQILQHGLDSIQESDFITPPVVDSGQWVVDSEQLVVDSEQWVVDSEQPTATSQQPTANSQQPTANSHQPPATSHQLPTVLDRSPAPVSQFPTIKEPPSHQPPAASHQPLTANKTLLIDTPPLLPPDLPSFPTATDPNLAISNQPTTHIPDYQPPVTNDQPPAASGQPPAASGQPPAASGQPPTATDPPDPADPFLDIPW